MSRKDVYLSVDLDYWDWDRLERHPKNVSRRSLEFFKRVLSTRSSIRVYVEHNEVLRDFKGKHGFSVVINVDFHDDIVAPYDVDHTPPEACWVNSVPGKEQMQYWWMYPSHKVCCVEGEGLCSNNGDYLWPSRWHDWGYIRRQEGLSGIPWNRVGAISVVLSPKFTCPMYVFAAITLLSNHNDVVFSSSSKLVIRDWKRLFPR